MRGVKPRRYAATSHGHVTPQSALAAELSHVWLHFSSRPLAVTATPAHENGVPERIDWILKQPIDVFVLELGGNDALRGIDPKNSYQNLKGIIEKVKAKYPEVKVVLAGMQAPPNMGKAYTDAFKNNYINLSKELNTALIPFLLENIGGIKDLNIKDGIHPNEKGQVIMADNVWKTLKTVL